MIKLDENIKTQDYGRDKMDDFREPYPWFVPCPWHKHYWYWIPTQNKIFQLGNTIYIPHE